MRNTVATVVLACAVHGAQAQAPTQVVRLSFAEAVSRAAGAAPAVQLAGLRITEADGQVREARGALLPSFAVGGQWVNRSYSTKSFGFSFPTVPGQPPLVPVLVAPFNNYDARLTATETLFDWSAAARVRAARAQADGSRAERGVSVEGAAQRAAVAYLQMARAASLAGARRADSSIAAELVRVAVAQKTAGVSSAIDVTRARTQSAIAEGLLVVAETDRDRARIDLARVLGIDPATPMEPTDTLSSALGTASVPAERDAAVAQAVATRPDVAAEVARGQAARRTSTAIAAERLPRISLEGDYGTNGPTVPSALGTRQIALAVNIPILDGLRREGRLATQDAIVEESLVREHDLRQQVAADVEAALLELRSASAQQMIAAERLRLAEDELAEARQRFTAGLTGNIEVIDAQASLIQAQDADVDARFGTAVARVALASAAGVARTLH